MVLKMKFVHLVGNYEYLDQVIDQYLDRYDIQLEDSYMELKGARHIIQNTETDPYKEILEKAELLAGMLPEKNRQAAALSSMSHSSMSIEEMIRLVEKVEEKRNTYQNKKQELIEKKQKIEGALEDILPYRNVNHDIQDILDFRFIKYRFGKVPVEYFQSLCEYIGQERTTIFYQSQVAKDYIYGVYFVPAIEAEKVDAVYATLHFERFYMPEGYEGTLEEAYEAYVIQYEEIKAALNRLEKERNDFLSEEGSAILCAREGLRRHSSHYNIKKLAACQKTISHTLFLLCGWMTEQDARRFKKEMEKEPDIYCLVDEEFSGRNSKPPTVLKNPGIFKPFEMFVRMYGLPDYHEMDPTLLVGLTYSILFGMMFGDLGQGLVLFLGGAVLYRLKKADMAAIVSCCGIFSAIFGWMYGSVFGFEDLIEARWLKPVSAMTDLPFIGRLNTVFVLSVGLGMGLILLMMLFHIRNSLKAKNLEAVLMDINGLAGLCFYGGLVATAVLFLTGNQLPAGIVLLFLFGVPLLVITFREPLTALLTKKGEVVPKEKVMFLVQGFFELFEMLLSYFSNTLSFVRIGAFAVSHAAMMEVVLMLAGAESGSPNWLVILFGNLFVCAMEGLVVGIQVLRLQYYEFFSRFYKGSGREFKPSRRIVPERL